MERQIKKQKFVVKNGVVYRVRLYDEKKNCMSSRCDDSLSSLLECWEYSGGPFNEDTAKFMSVEDVAAHKTEMYKVYSCYVGGQWKYRFVRLE